MSAIDDLPPLRDIITSTRCRRESLGQNFLLDLNLARIARPPLEDCTRSRSGPPRGLTRALLAMGARRVIAVERDERAIDALGYIVKRYGRIEIVHGDAQRLILVPADGGKAKIVANLPYNIATQLLVDWLSIEPWPPWYDTMVLINSGGRRRITPTRTSVAGSRCRQLAPRPRSCSTFRPRPSCRTESHVLGGPIDPAPSRATAACSKGAAAFGQRRKMLRQSLKSLGLDPARLAAAADIDPTRRAETVPISGFVAMARELADIRAAKPS